MGRGRTRRDSVGTPEFAFQDRCLQPLGHHTGSSKSPLRLGGLRNQASGEVTLTGPYIDELIDQLPFVSKPVHFGELCGVLYDLLGQPADGPSDPPSMTPPRRRRTSGHHEV
jgi:hypothetical protein